ncbi:hypothetical protein CHX27_06825 [Flavobacterium aurantiibacter]|uniref:Uncharacterized protein n=1 Tax=Flavobacterium aurantiibacter TaxID=2023067 RepID=A0A255ZUG9_9FLAO|nr:hypothetical protein CHX27_06825 [Flavobacterium aurantiibacter]
MNALKNSNGKPQKSLQQRFLFVIGILFFIAYLVLGLMIIFLKSIPFNISDNYRILLGSVLIIYAFFRFIRLFQQYK